MPTYVVRVWVPDRPGALGAVASRIGAVRGDLVGIDILERGAGTAIDELVVSLPDAALVPLLLKEIGEVDGVAVEDVHQVPGDGLPDARLAALEAAAVLVEETTTQGVLRSLVVHASHDFQAEWVAITDSHGQVLHASTGSPPPLSWIRAFVAGSRSMAAAADGAEALGAADDMAWTPLVRAGLDLVFGRPGRPVRTRERLQLNALASIADARWIELARRDAVIHPRATS